MTKTRVHPSAAGAQARAAGARAPRARPGDDGMTFLPVAGRVAKNHPRLEACGSLDELSCALGELIARIEAAPPGGNRRDPFVSSVRRIQGELLFLGSWICTGMGNGRGDGARRRAMLRRLDGELEALKREMPPPGAFILPGGGAAGSGAHLARAVCRRAERDCVAALHGDPLLFFAIPYLNRLGDWLFGAARCLAKWTGARERLWRPPGNFSRRRERP